MEEVDTFFLVDVNVDVVSRSRCRRSFKRSRCT